MREIQSSRPGSTINSDLSARELLTPLFRRKKLLALTFCSVVGLVLLYSLVKGPSYSAHMAILVNRERLDPLVSSEATTQMTIPATAVEPEEVNSEIQLLTSRDVLEKVVIANGLDKPSPGFSFGDLIHPNQTREDRIARAVKSLATKIKTEVTTKTNIIEVTFSSPDPQLSYGVLKSLGEFYAAKHAAVHRPAGSYEFFATETQKYHDDLQNAEQKLRDFGRQNAIAAPDEQRTQLAGQVANSVGTLHATEQQIAADEERIQDDRRQLQSTPQRSATIQASAVNDKLLEDLNGALLAAQAKRTQLAVKYEPSYPLVREADDEVAQAKAAIAQAEQSRNVTETTDRDPTYELLREDMAKSQADLAAQKATLEATKRSVHDIQTQMVSLDQFSLTQQDLEREAKADEGSYLLYLGKREQERTTDALDSTRIANVAIAIPPAIPVLPVLSWPLILLIALGSGLVLSIVVAYGMDFMDSSFHTPAQVIEMMGIPVVVAVSKKTA